MDPSPREHRTWKTHTFFLYWLSDLVYPATWATVASFVTLGLTWWESCLAIFVGGLLAALVITGTSHTQRRVPECDTDRAANAIVGATVHTPFAVTSRSTFGYWGSKMVVAMRMVIACFWLSINSWSYVLSVLLMRTMADVIEEASLCPS
jgi:NCS1 family nucleobase:cation symporter-1